MNKPTLGIIGGGQLGSLLADAAKKIDSKFRIEEMTIWMTHIGGYPNKYHQRVREELKKIIDMLLDSAIGSKTTELAAATALGPAGATQVTKLTPEIAELQAIKSLPAAPYLSTKVKTS